MGVFNPLGIDLVSAKPYRYLENQYSDLVYVEETDKLYVEYIFVDPEGIPENWSVGTPSIAVPQTVSVRSLSEETAVGSPRVAQNPDPVSIESRAKVYKPTVLPQPVVTSPIGIESTAETGNHEIVPGEVVLHALGIDETSSVGTPNSNLRIYPKTLIGLSALQIDTYEEPGYFNYGDEGHFYNDSAFSSDHKIKTAVRIKNVGGISSVAEFGDLRSIFAIKPTSIRSTAVVTTPNVRNRVVIVGGIPSVAEVGVPKVIQTFIWNRIRRFDPELFFSLLEKEQYCYTRPNETNDGTLREIYEPRFKLLGNAIIQWMDINRKADIKKLMNGLFGYIAFHAMYGTDYSLYEPSKVKNLFSINGYIPRIKNEPVDYYHDLVVQYDEITGAPIGYETPRLDADTAFIPGAYTAQEKPNLESLVEGYIEVIGDMNHDLMFTDIPPIRTMSKVEVADEIFINLGYKAVYETMNVGLELPPRIKDM